MKIPKSFQLFGVTVEVELIPGSLWKHEDDCVGIWYETRFRIELVSREDQPPEARAQVFIHELLHACFDMLGYDKLSKDEQMVDALASLLHQALTSAKYE